MRSREPADVRTIEEVEGRLLSAALAASMLLVDAERRRHWTEVTHDLLRIVVPPMEPRTALQQVARLARGLTGGAGAFVLPADRIDRLELLAADGPASTDWSCDALATLVGRSATSLQPILLARPGEVATTAT